MARRRPAAPAATGGLELDLFAAPPAATRAAAPVESHAELHGEPRVDERPRRAARRPPMAEEPARAATALPASALPDEDLRIDSYEELGDGFPGASREAAVPVSALTQTAREILEGAFVPLWVRGEVSDFKAHRNGHWYFCLRDERAQIRCVVWSRDQRGIPATPDVGMQVTAFGQLTVYPARGEMQFVVRRLEAEGDGLWRKAMELTIARLDAEGLLAPDRKRELPRHPRRIAVITSPDGAALHDIVAVLRRRAPGVEVVVVPAAVQGESAPVELVAALDRVARWRACDTVIIGRGGGGREDLWAFNDERVARAVAACPIPIISAVGHEVDVTICDLVADWRAPTPSAAAEAAVRAYADAEAELRALRGRLLAAVALTMGTAREGLHRAGRDLSAVAGRDVERRRARVERVAGQLHALSPLATLARGYAVARAPDGRALTRVGDFAPGAPFDLVLRDGQLRARVEASEGDRG